MGLRADACAILEAYRMGWAVSSGDARRQAWLHRQQALTLQFFASQLARATNCLRFLSNSPFGRLFVVTVQPHLAKDALALHFLLQHPKSLVHVVVAHENLHLLFPFGPRRSKH
jgi:hypothetical protein